MGGVVLPIPDEYLRVPGIVVAHPGKDVITKRSVYVVIQVVRKFLYGLLSFGRVVEEDLEVIAVKSLPHNFLVPDDGVEVVIYVIADLF